MQGLSSRHLSQWILGTIAVVAPLAFSVPVWSQSQAVPSNIPLKIETEGGSSVPFWPEAQRLTQTQINLLARVNAAFQTPDPNSVRVARGQLILMLGELDRFSTTQSPQSPEIQPQEAHSSAKNQGLNCHPPDNNATALRCQVRQIIPQWEALLPLLDSRLAMLGTIAEVKPLPLVKGENTIGRGGIPTFARGSLRGTAIPLNSPLPQVVRVTPPLGSPVKSALGDYQAPLDPAVAPMGAGLGQVDRLKSQLQQIQQLFPRGTQFSNPDSIATTAIKSNASLQSVDRTDPDLKDYVALLEEPHTGLAVIRPPQPLPVLVNRLDPLPSSFSPLTPGRKGFQPRLTLAVSPQTDGADLAIVMSDLDYGFLLPLGDVPLAQVAPNLLNLKLSSALREFILGYRPPQNLEALQIDRRRFVSGKEAAFPALAHALSTQVPLALHQTYLLRSFQFQVPPLLAQRQFSISGDRRYMAEALEIPSSDVLLVLRPIDRRPDGSYRVVWRMLQEFPAPQIRDLQGYFPPR